MTKSFKAKWSGSCRDCRTVFAEGAVVVRHPDGEGYLHYACGLARDEFARNQQQVLSGETYASKKPSDYRRGKSPGSSRTPY